VVREERALPPAPAATLLGQPLRPEPTRLERLNQAVTVVLGDRRLPGAPVIRRGAPTSAGSTARSRPDPRCGATTRSAPIACRIGG
jgi:hypothetical protein